MRSNGGQRGGTAETGYTGSDGGLRGRSDGSVLPPKYERALRRSQAAEEQQARFDAERQLPVQILPSNGQPLLGHSRRLTDRGRQAAGALIDRVQ